MKIYYNYIAIIIVAFLFIACDEKANIKDDVKENSTINNSINNGNIDTNNKTLVTFIELGSSKCIPCKKMQPIMASLEKKYGSQLEVIFYDVVKKENKDRSKEFGIRLIPTQIFIDNKGKEIHRHEGFYPESDIDEFLKKNGLKLIEKNAL